LSVSGGPLDKFPESQHQDETIFPAALPDPGETIDDPPTPTITIASSRSKSDELQRDKRAAV
jgi:hypothetical protein